MQRRNPETPLAKYRQLIETATSMEISGPTATAFFGSSPILAEKTVAKLNSEVQEILIKAVATRLIPLLLEIISSGVSIPEVLAESIDSLLEYLETSKEINHLDLSKKIDDLHKALFPAVLVSETMNFTYLDTCVKLIEELQSIISCFKIDIQRLNTVDRKHLT